MKMIRLNAKERDLIMNYILILFMVNGSTYRIHIDCTDQWWVNILMDYIYILIIMIDIMIMDDYDDLLHTYIFLKMVDRMV